MTTTIAVVMDPIESISVKKDSTLAMLVAALHKGWDVYYITQAGMYAEQGVAKARCQQLTHASFDPTDYYRLQPGVDRDLASFDVILMRKDPPFDMEFIYSTYLLEQAEQAGSLVVNKPQALRDCNEKLFATQFPQCCPPVLVSSDATRLKAFAQTQGDAIFKPLDGMGGSSIFRVQAGDSNTNVIIETLTRHGTTPIMAQRYLPEIVNGDKRILLINGKPIPYCLARIPSQGESRGNLAAGGRGVAQPLSDRDRWICEQVGPSLVQRGIVLAGLDVIGDYLTEINITSPTCLREIDAAYDTNIAGQLIDAIAELL